MNEAPSTIRVFISSTFRDMHAERDHLVTVVFPELRERLEEIDLRFFDVDLRWGVPQTDVDGERANSWEYCKRWIERVEPFFIVLLGQRYGWVPLSEDLRDPTDRRRYGGMSITEMEIRHAVLEGGLQRRAFFYLRDRPVPEGVAPEIYREYVDDEDAPRIELLQQAIAECGRPVRRYDCYWDGTSFTDLEAFGRLVLEDIWSGVLRDRRYFPDEAWRDAGDRFPEAARIRVDEGRPIPEPLWRELLERRRPAHMDAFAIERESMARFAASRLQWFTGRSTELRQLRDFVDRDAAALGASVAVLQATPGQGKTALLARFAASLPALDVAGFTHFVGATARSADSHWLLQRLDHEISRSGLGAQSEDDLRQERDVRKRVHRRLAALSGPERLVIIVDGVNQLRRGLDLSWLPPVVGPAVRIIISCAEPLPDQIDSPEALVVEALRRREQPILWLALTPLSAEEIRAVVATYLEEYCKRLDAPDIDAIATLPQAGNPLYLLVLLSELRTLGGHDMHLLVPRIIDSVRFAYPDTVRLFEWVLQRLEVFGQDDVRMWCTYLYLARDGMQSRELGDLLSKLGPEGARAARRIERGLRRYLIDRGGLLDFFHGQLREAVAHRYDPAAVAREAHGEIAAYFRKREPESAHATHELVYHLARADLATDLYQVLGDVDFRKRKVRVCGGVAELRDDLLLGFDVAARHDDVGQLAQIGFLHADATEHPGSRRDILVSYADDPEGARSDLALYAECPRARLLLLLALLELDAGQPVLADRHLRQLTALPGSGLGESDRAFVTEAVRRLAAAGCPSAPGVLRALGPMSGAAAAASVASGTDAAIARNVIDAALEWLAGQATLIATAEQFLETYHDLAMQVSARLESGYRRELFDKLHDLARAVSPASGVFSQIAEGLIGGRGRGSAGATQAALAFLGAAQVRAGELQGWDRLAEAIESTDFAAVEPAHTGRLVRALVDTGDGRALPLFRSLLARIRRHGFVDHLEAILDRLLSSESAADSLPYFRAVEAATDGVEAKDCAPITHLLALGLARDGDRNARERLGVAYLGIGPLFLRALVRSPLLPPQRRVAALVREITLAPLTRPGDASWLESWTKVGARLLRSVFPERDRAEAIRKFHVALVRADGKHLTSLLLPAIDSLVDEVRRFELLDELLVVAGPEAAATLSSAMRVRTRRFADRELAWRLEQRIAEQVGVEINAGTADREAELADLAPVTRTRVLARIAATLLCAGKDSASYVVWQAAAFADQEALSLGATVFAARSVAAARATDIHAWQQIVDAMPCQDPRVGAKLVQTVAAACRDRRRLRALASSLRRMAGNDIATSAARRAGYAALTEAWLRLGAIRAATTAWRRSGRQGARLAALLAGTRAGLRWTLSQSATDSLPRIRGARMRRRVAAFLHVSLRRAWFQSKWARFAAIANLARAVAMCDQPDAARELLQQIEIPMGGDHDLGLTPVAKAEALLAVGNAHAELYRRTDLQTDAKAAENALAGAVDEAMRVVPARRGADSSKLVGDLARDTASRVVVRAWEQIHRLRLLVAPEVLERVISYVYSSARSTPSGIGGRWDGLHELAMGWARVGKPHLAMKIVATHPDQEARDRLCESLISSNDTTPETTLRCWDLLSGPGPRERAARAFLAAASSAQAIDDDEPKGAPWPQPFRSSWRLWRIVLSLLVVFVGPFAASWWLVAHATAITAWLRAAPWSWPLVTILAVWSATRIAAELASVVRDRRLRLLVTAAAILLFPVTLGVMLLAWAAERELPFRTWLFLLAHPGYGVSSATAQEPPPIQRATYYPLLRRAAAEAFTFDSILAAMLLRDPAMSSPPPELLQHLPPLRLPSVVPDEIAQSRRDTAAWRAERRRLVPLRRRLRKLLESVGVSVMRKLTWPMAWASARATSRRHDRAVALARDAERLLGAGDAARAADLYTQATQLMPAVPEYWSDRGIALAEARRRDEAIASLREATRRGAGSPREYVFWYNLAFNLWNAGDHEEAMEAFQRCIDLAPRDDELYASAVQGRSFCQSALR